MAVPPKGNEILQLLDRREMDSHWQIR